ncbi:type IV conjugative transfer system protein TraE [Pelomicrobium methylotrophicum]|uniref:Type IV conjugative transfer system protein TraE n=1 Tax=Pelomicrobium methylotrophicum TaxID=2602750 RepID=A0A5C7EJN6_9PROT|nr:type IV conjugative transfer system protein TraE [Pelomicrobium methylotrophicum]TXF11198.1 type IV conjugative transfer system protein TraE [Pelomicrobium methylotrophicum]
MLFRKYVSERENERREIRFLRLLAALLAVMVLAQSLAMIRLAGAEKTVLVPPEIRRSFWVSGNAVSREYLEEMAYWYAGLALNVTPAVSDYQNSLFLKYAAPSEYGRLQAEMGARAEFLKRNNTATQFSVRNVTTDEKGLKVALSGVLVTWTSDKKAGERNATYLVGFRFMNGRLYVSEFKETSDQNPFGDAAAGQP